MTKAFTTALLGDAVLAGRLKLTLPLSRLDTLLGPMPRSTQAVTLLNLGSFTAGLESYLVDAVRASSRSMAR